jgi:glycosyltransferase involved in cell wall biosynthesis
MAKKPLPEKLNICILAFKFPILGLATDHGFLWPVARGLVKRGHNVTVLSWKNPQGEKEILQDGVKAYFLGESSYPVATTDFPEMALKKFERLHRESPFHILHSIDASGYEIARQKKNFRLAVAYDVEATQLSQIFSILGYAQESLGSLLSTGINVSYKFLTTYFGRDRKLLKTADGVFVTSPQQRLALERYYLHPDRKTYIVPYGIEIGDLSPREKSEELRKKLGIPANGHVVVTVTDMVEFGELQTLLRAFEKLAIKKPASRLIIVGNGPLKNEIEYEMLMLALGSKVIFTGPVSSASLSDYIALADIFVNLSARTSGFEASVLEAMAQKKLIIGSEVSPLATVVEAGKDGFLLRPADTGALAQLLIRICSEELPIAEIGDRARNKVMNLFDMNKMLNLTLEAYFKTLLNTGLYKKRPVSVSSLVSSPV